MWLIINDILFFCYSLFIAWLVYGIVKSSPQEKEKRKINGISLLIPFRNEERRIIPLLKSLKQLDSSFEVLFIDDHSGDKTKDVIKHYLCEAEILSLPQGIKGKKKAIDYGVKKARFNFIVTTDADCSFSKSRLKEYRNAFQQGYRFVFAPVLEKGNNETFIRKLKHIESVVLAGTMMGSAKNKKPLLISGANMGYEKNLYLEKNPYAQNWQIASGDDMFFLEKIKNVNYKILDDYSALVYTPPFGAYKEIIHQSIRWSSKTKKLDRKFFLIFGGLVFIVNMILLFDFFVVIFSPSAIHLWFLLGGKFVADISLFYTSSLKLKQRRLLYLLPFMYILYPIHLLIIFVASLFMKTTWKQREI